MIDRAHFEGAVNTLQTMLILNRSQRALLSLQPRRGLQSLASPVEV